MASLLLFLVAISSFCNLSRITGANSTQGGPYVEIYDYIVVDSGPGCAPLAARLGLAGKKVLVIEAGSDVTPQDCNITVPLFNSKASEDLRISWDFYVCSADT